MNLYELINPSDALTFYAPTIEVAGAAIGILGGGAYGAKDCASDEQTPVLLGWKEWLAEHGMDDLNDWSIKHGAEIVAALRSVYLGKPAERPDLDRQLAAQGDTTALIAFRLARNNRERSSTNDIEGDAHDLADSIEKKLADMERKQKAAES